MSGIRIVIRPSDGWPRDTVAMARRQIEFALGRFAGRVRSLSLRLVDLNGPRGGADKKCLIAVRLSRPDRLIVVEDVDPIAAAAIHRAVARMSRAVARAVHAASDWHAMPRSFRGATAVARAGRNGPP